MKLPSSNDRAPVGANMTPMIDVVFLLIIFFLVSSHLARQEHRMPLALPAASTTFPQSVESQALTVNVDQEGRIYVGGTRIEVVDLGNVLIDHLERRGEQAGLRIRTDKEAAYQFVEPILRRAGELGFTDITLAASSANGGR
ncbi:MAG: biopolymer transporter ExbD [Planctomycetota bacterium]